MFLTDPRACHCNEAGQQVMPWICLLSYPTCPHGCRFLKTPCIFRSFTIKGSFEKAKGKKQMQRKWYKAQALGCPLRMLIATGHRTKISRAIHSQIENCCPTLQEEQLLTGWFWVDDSRSIALFHFKPITRKNLTPPAPPFPSSSVPVPDRTSSDSLTCIQNAKWDASDRHYGSQ